VKKEIYFKAIQTNGNKYFRWAWSESWCANIFGRATSLDEIKRRSKKMFPSCDCVLIAQ
jgi:hypothetical protein